MDAWRAIRQSETGRTRFALAIAVGVFIANLPLYGVQTIVSLFAARRFRLQPLAVIAGSHLSTPPIGPLLIAAAIATGHLLLHGRFPLWADFNPGVLGYGALIRSVFLEWAIGGVICGALLGGAAFLVMQLVLRCVPVRRPGETEAPEADVAPDCD